MKKILYTTTIILLAVFSAKAQDTRGISIENPSIEITGETLDIRFNVKASNIDLRCDGQLKLEFAIENADRRLILPVVIYSGTTRYHYEQRRETLSDNYTPEPYRIYKGVKKNRSYELEYRLSVPYYTWMEHASITYREYTHDCSGDLLSGAGYLVADINPAPVYVAPEVWMPDTALMPNLVSFLVPEVEEVKARASMVELNINFPVNVTEVRPTYMNNPDELRRADSLLYVLNNNNLLDIRGVSIKGYASPEGRYAANERLARGRSEGFKTYLIRQNPYNEYIRNASTSWVAEDWEGLARLVEASDLSHKDEVLSVILDGSLAPDTKEQVLQKIGQWSYVYKPMLDNMFPKLRRIELRVDYTVDKLSDSQARELLYTDAGLLSLEEIYRVARYYEPGSRQYREVYEIAARQFPNDIIANNNAAAALLQEGNTDAAMPYLEKTANDPVSYINYGAYYYLSGDLERATEYFTMAKGAGIEQADHNLRLINAGK